MGGSVVRPRAAESNLHAVEQGEGRGVSAVPCIEGNTSDSGKSTLAHELFALPRAGWAVCRLCARWGGGSTPHPTRLKEVADLGPPP
jgi:hypothetical protein